MHYYQFNIGDYQSHTAHLSDTEDLAYRRLLDWAYLHEKPLPNDIEEIGRLIRMRSHCDCIATVLREFFLPTSEGWVSERVEREIAGINTKSEKARTSAKARWNKGFDANAMRSHSERNATQDPIPNTHNPIPKTQKASSTAKADEELFAQFWEAYPRKEAKAKAKQAFAKHKPTPELVAAMVAALDAQKQSDQWRRDGGQFIPHATTWLNQERWNDEIAPPRSVAMPMSKSGEHSRTVLSGLTRGFMGGRPDAKLLGK